MIWNGSMERSRSLSIFQALLFIVAVWDTGHLPCPQPHRSISHEVRSTRGSTVGSKITTSDTFGREKWTVREYVGDEEEEPEREESAGTATDVWPPVANAARATVSDRTTAVEARTLPERRDVLCGGCPPTTEGQISYLSSSLALALALPLALDFG